MEKKNLNNYFTYFKDKELRDIYFEEYLDWNKTGVLKDGKLKTSYNEFEKVYGINSLTAIEKTFLAECASRFIINLPLK